MESSIFLSKILGPLFIVVPLSFLLKKQNYSEIVKDFLGNAGMRYFGGCIDELETYERELDGLEILALLAADWAGKCRPAVS